MVTNSFIFSSNVNHLAILASISLCNYCTRKTINFYLVRCKVLQTTFSPCCCFLLLRHFGTHTVVCLVPQRCMCCQCIRHKQRLHSLSSTHLYSRQYPTVYFIYKMYKIFSRKRCIKSSHYIQHKCDC